jgi:hypothetical protein
MTELNSPPTRGGYWDLRPDVAVSPETLPAPSAQTTDGTLRGRLAALDHLYESNAITRTELSEARNAILGGQVGEGHAPLIGADASLFVNGAAPTKVAGLPVWATAGIAAALVVARAAPTMPSLRRRA